jgi:YD repeat-containing protein
MGSDDASKEKDTGAPKDSLKENNADTSRDSLKEKKQTTVYRYIYDGDGNRIGKSVTLNKRTDLLSTSGISTMVCRRSLQNRMEKTPLCIRMALIVSP